MDSWINLMPSLPHQNTVNCYGIIRIMNGYFVVSDLVQDDVELATEK